MSEEGKFEGKDLELIIGHKKSDIPGLIATSKTKVVLLGLDSEMVKAIQEGQALVWDSDEVKIILTHMMDDEDYKTMSKTWSSQLQKVERLKHPDGLKPLDE